MSGDNGQCNDGICAWCRDPLGEVAEEFNDGVGHPECIGWVCEQLDLPPSPRRRFYRVDPAVGFLERLGAEAVRLGIDPQKLAAAATRARR